MANIYFNPYTDIIPNPKIGMMINSILDLPKWKIKEWNFTGTWLGKGNGKHELIDAHWQSGLTGEVISHETLLKSLAI